MSTTTVLLLILIRWSRGASERSRLPHCTSFYTNRISFHQINPVLRQETCVLIGYYLLYMKSTNRLMMTTKKSGVFVDISKTLEKVWQVDLLYELKQNSIEDNLVKTWTDFSSSRKQELLWAVSIQQADGESGVPQGSILGLFLIYISDLFDNYYQILSYS